MRNTRNLFAYSLIASLLFWAAVKQAGTAETKTASPESKAATPIDTAKQTAGQRPTTAGKPARSEVLAPDLFFGETQEAYEAAKQCPEICAKLFCYCGCDVTDSHVSLLDCFTSDHGSDCEVCKGEVFLALGMKNQGKTLAEIQRAVDEKYLREYPFDNPSANLKSYRSTRLWQPATKESIAGQGKSSEPNQSTPPQLKAGKKIGNCCGGKKHGN